MKALFRILLLALPLAALATDTFTEQVIDVAGLQQAYASVAKGGSIIPAPEKVDRAIVRYSELPAVQKRAWAMMAKRYGVKVTSAGPEWDTRFDCVAYAMAFNLELRGTLFREYWRSRSSARRPACIMALYTPERPIIGDIRNHAVCFIVTDRGPVWWDPVIGEVTLNEKEIKTLYFFTP